MKFHFDFYVSKLFLLLFIVHFGIFCVFFFLTATSNKKNKNDSEMKVKKRKILFIGFYQNFIFHPTKEGRKRQSE
jgi:hypothetical protein